MHPHHRWAFTETYWHSVWHPEQTSKEDTAESPESGKRQHLFQTLEVQGGSGVSREESRHGKQHVGQGPVRSTLGDPICSFSQTRGGGPHSSEKFHKNTYFKKSFLIPSF